MMDSKITKYSLFSILSLLIGVPAQAKEIDTNMAQMQAMDKITGRVSVIDVPVNGETRFGSFSIVVRACKTRPPEETPENYAFVDVVDSYDSEKPVNIFKGWMLSSSPALNAVAHPIYDVWLLKCHDTQVDPSALLTAEQLDSRDKIVRAVETQPVTEEISDDTDNKAPASAADESSVPQPGNEQQSEEKTTETEDTAPKVNNADILQQETSKDQDAPTSLINIHPTAEDSDEENGVSLPEKASLPEADTAVVEAQTFVENPETVEVETIEADSEQDSLSIDETQTDEADDVTEAEPLRDEQFIDFSGEEIPEDSYDLNVEALKI